MPEINLTFGDGAFANYADRETIHIKDKINVAILERGMTSGKPSAAFGFELPDGKFVVAETSVSLLLTILKILGDRYPELMK